MTNFKPARGGLLRFFRHRAGSVSIIAGFAILAIFTAVGAGIDLAHSYQVRQGLSQAAAMACQYSTRSTVTYIYGSQNSAAYQSNVNAYLSNYLTAQGISASSLKNSANPFTLNGAGAGNVQLGANVPTYIMSMFHIDAIPVAAATQCFSNIANLPQHSPTEPTPGTVIVGEGFENTGCTGTCWYQYAPGVPPGTFISTPTSTFPSTSTYTGSSGVTWFVVGYCLEDDSIGEIFSTAAQGTHSAELDCDNGSGSAGNSSISTQTYLAAGAYELRWSYRGRVDYPDYDPAYICGSQASDLSWANDTNSSGGPVANAYRTNQINVYLDYVPNQTTFPGMHTTYDNKTLAGSNLVDMCVYSNEWIQRSVKITVTQPGYYWLSFAADGQNDSYGGSIDNIMLCASACSGSVSDNFPPSWVASGGVTLFNDGFSTPSYSSSSHVYTSGDITRSVGTSGSGSGWPNQSATGWDIGPDNQISYLLGGGQSGGQAVQIDGANGSGSSSANTEISRPFLLVPGYYQVSYYYISDVTFSSLSTTANYYCGATPAAANYSALSTSATGKYTPTGVSASHNLDTNIVGIFMSHAQLTSHPNAPSLGSASTYANDPSVPSSPLLPADNAVSLTSYNSAQVNPLLDLCGYSGSWTKRTVNIQISKTAYYWLTAASLGTADGYGGAIDSLSLVALGSPYMASPPSNPVAIPVPSPQPGASLGLPSFYPSYNIIADSFAP